LDIFVWNVGGRCAQRTRGRWIPRDRSHRTRTFHPASCSVVTSQHSFPSASAHDWRPRETALVYSFSDTNVFAASVRGRRFICSITSPAIILRSSCSWLVISRGFVSRIQSDPIGRPLGPRKGTPA